MKLPVERKINPDNIVEIILKSNENWRITQNTVGKILKIKKGNEKNTIHSRYKEKETS